MNKKILAVAIAGAVAVPMAAQAIEYKISGHVNRMIRYADNSDTSDIQSVDNGASMTRFRIQGSEDIGNGLKAGVYIESAISSDSSSITPMKVNGGAAFDNAFNIRHSALFFSGNWGKVTMGHTSEAQDGTSFADLSNTWLVNEWSSAELAGAVSFGGVGGAGTSISSAFNSFDGGRNDLVRYDSPALGPVTLAASLSNNDRWSLAAYANTSLGGGELSAAMGYTSIGGSNPPAAPPAVDNQYSASVSYLFSQGTSITGGYGGGDLNGAGSDPDSYYVKLGHQWGSHAVSLHYNETQDFSADGEDNSFWGLGWVYTMRKDIEIYAGYNNYALDRAGADDVDVVVAGTRVKF